VIVRDYMFRHPLGDDGLPLWDSQRAMARALVELPDGGYHRKPEESVRVFLSQVLKPFYEPSSRPVSSNLRRCIPILVQKRISDPRKAKEVSENILRYLDQLKDPGSYEQPVSDDVEWNALFSATSDPSLHHVVIITDQPAETRLTDDVIHAPALTRAMIDKIISSDGSGYDREGVYDFFILDAVEATKARANIALHVASHLEIDRSAAEKLVRQAEVRQQLNMYHLEYDGFLPPLCVFDPLTRGIAFNLYYHAGSKVSVSRMNDISVRNWQEKFYLPLIQRNKKFVLHKKGEARPFQERSNIVFMDVAQRGGRRAAGAE
jgi:hypothetical protein